MSSILDRWQEPDLGSERVARLLREPPPEVDWRALIDEARARGLEPVGRVWTEQGQQRRG